MEPCPKCGSGVPPGQLDCPRCGIVIAKFTKPPTDLWYANIGGKQHTANFATLRQWAAEGKLGPTDRVFPPGGAWTPVHQVPGLVILLTTGGLDAPCEPID